MGLLIGLLARNAEHSSTMDGKKKEKKKYKLIKMRISGSMLNMIQGLKKKGGNKMLSKTINIAGIWHRINLTEEETAEVMEKLLEKNCDILSKCEAKAQEYNKVMRSQLSYAEIVKMLYEKQSIASFTALSNALDDKSFNMKNKIPTEKTEREEEPLDSHEPSTLDRMFDK